jgi:hypothetical protein
MRENSAFFQLGDLEQHYNGRSIKFLRQKVRGSDKSTYQISKSVFFGWQPNEL